MENMEPITEQTPDILPDVPEEPETTEIPEIQEPVYQVFVRVDDQGRITAVNSSAFLTDTEGWTLIDEGTEWPKYMHAQGNYFDKPIYTDDGFARYKLVDGQAVERTKEEMDADRANVPEPAPTQLDVIEAQVTYTALMTDTLLEV